MNAASSSYDEQEFGYRNRESRQKSTSPDHSRRSQNANRRRGKAPAQFNGIHRRRSKKISW